MRIKTWRERMTPQSAVPRPPEHAVYVAMEAEIRDLRREIDKFSGVGEVLRIGKRADGDRWHHALFTEDGSVDLPAGTTLFAQITKKYSLLD